MARADDPAIAERWRDLSLEGRTAIVTGGARGIGRAIAFRLAGLGARTMLWDLDAPQVERTAMELHETLVAQNRPAGVECAVVDVTDLAQVMTASEEIA